MPAVVSSSKMRVGSPVVELHIAMLGMNGSGKSALTVRYISRRFIVEYDPKLEDTYCRRECVLSQPLMVWMMDTVEETGKDRQRYLSWADIYVVVYDVTSQQSLQYAENLLESIATHEHRFCARDHMTIVLGNKIDLERYRQVSESEGERLASRFGARFAETSAAHAAAGKAIEDILADAMVARLHDGRSPSPRMCSSDSEIVSTPRRSRSGAGALAVSLRSGGRALVRAASRTRKAATPSSSSPSCGTPSDRLVTPLHKVSSVSRLKSELKMRLFSHSRENSGGSYQ